MKYLYGALFWLLANPTLQPLQGCLAEDEVKRANQLRFRRDRDGFICLA